MIWPPVILFVLAVVLFLFVIVYAMKARDARRMNDRWAYRDAVVVGCLMLALCVGSGVLGGALWVVAK